VGPRRTLQLSMVLAAVLVLALALTGAFSPAAGAVPVDAPAAVSTR
jgi:hypothetical protein